MAQTQAQAKAARERAAKKRAGAAGTKVVKGKPVPKAPPAFDQTKQRPKGGLGGLAKRVKTKKAKKKKQ